MAARESSPELSIVADASVEETEAATDSRAEVEADVEAVVDVEAVADVEAVVEDGSIGETGLVGGIERRLAAIPRLLLLALLALILFVAFQQFRRAEVLATHVTALEAELERSSQELMARRAHLRAVQGSVAELDERVQNLNSLVNRDPMAAVKSRQSSSVGEPTFASPSPASPSPSSPR